jgi:hypothetical protein
VSSASEQTVPAERKSIQEVAIVCAVRRVSSYRGVMRTGKKEEEKKRKNV